MIIKKYDNSLRYDMQEITATNRVLGEVFDERRRQDEKWGVQDHNDNTGRGEWKLAADYWKSVNQSRAQFGIPSWCYILLEEVFEALAETGPQLLRAELVQSAAVCVAWIEAIDRRSK
jgi:hypothetical protein